MYVVVQFILIAAVFLSPTEPGWDGGVLALWLGRAAQVVAVVIMVLAALRLGRGLTASPVPNTSAQLRRDGVYAFARHPMYTGVLLLCLGEVILSGSLISAVCWVVLVWWLTQKSRWEELQLAARFPDYPEYAATRGRFLPRLRQR